MVHPICICVNAKIHLSGKHLPNHRQKYRITVNLEDRFITTCQVGPPKRSRKNRQPKACAAQSFMDIRQGERDKMEYILDFQGFRDARNEFIIKELVLISTDGQVYELQLFLPPCDFHLLPRQIQKQVVWLEKQHHGLFWGSGFKNYNEFNDCLMDL